MSMVRINFRLSELRWGLKLMKTSTELICPHCEGEINLAKDEDGKPGKQGYTWVAGRLTHQPEDAASGEFKCPLCDGVFEWNVEEDESFDDA